MFSCKFAAYSQNTFTYEHLWRAASKNIKIKKTYIENLNITFSVTLVRYYQSFLKGTEYVSTQTSDFLHISLFSKAQILCGLAETHQNSREIVQEL